MDRQEENFKWLAKRLGVLALIISPLMLGGCPHYSVWQQEMTGRAEFSRAEQNRKIRVELAKAQDMAAEFEAKAEVKKAEGAAKANEIMLKSLSAPGAENYLRWKYIQMLDEGKDSKSTQREIIYVPMDGMLPMTEAGRAVRVPKQ